MLRQISAHEGVGRTETLDWQEGHSPTSIEEIQIQLSDGKRVTRERVRRRAQDARLWSRLAPLQQAAAERIANGFRVIVAGLGSKGQVFERSYSRSSRDGGEAVMRDYHSWTTEAKAQGVDVNSILAVLVEGHGVKQVDLNSRKRRGTTMNNLVQGLDTYIRLMRW